jgi:prevent-host-death family protein
METIGIFEAKTRLSEIVRHAEMGERVTITVRGRAAAEVGPVQQTQRMPTDEERDAAFQRLMNPAIKGVDGETVLEWIREGRK